LLIFWFNKIFADADCFHTVTKMSSRLVEGRTFRNVQSD
jgi:hypothetical protein